MKPLAHFYEIIGERGAQEMDDRAIVELYWERDEQALAQTQKKYHKYLYKIAAGFLADPLDREESVNDTYMAAWDTIPPQRPQSLAGYLSKLIRRISIDRLRRITAQKRGGTEYALSLSELAGCVAGGPEPEDSLETKRLAACLNSFLRELSREERALFVGRYYFMDSLKETARYCGMTESKAKSMLFRIRCHLREYLVEEGFVV